MFLVPGKPYKGALPELTADEQSLSKRLSAHKIMKPACSSIVVAAILTSAAVNAAPAKNSTEAAGIKQHLLNDKFTPIGLKALPKGVRDYYKQEQSRVFPQEDYSDINRIFATGKRCWQNGCVRSARVPPHYLLFAAASKDLCVVAFLSAGYGISQNVDVFRIDGKDKARLVLSGSPLSYRPWNMADLREATKKDTLLSRSWL